MSLIVYPLDFQFLIIEQKNPSAKSNKKAKRQKITHALLLSFDKSKIAAHPQIKFRAVKK